MDSLLPCATALLDSPGGFGNAVLSVWRHIVEWVTGLEWGPFVVVGLLGNAAFSVRFLVQWMASERRRESVIPVAFWYWSIGGTLLMLAYFVERRDPVGILAYLPNTAIYLRNLHFIRLKAAAGGGAPGT